MEYEYDYLIVGAGLAGCTAANILANKGYKVLAEQTKER
jgi:choline dehydrogenase-like flavoprotein